MRYRCLKKTHTAVQKAVTAVKALEGCSPTDGSAEISAPKSRQSVLTRAKMFNVTRLMVLESLNRKPIASFEQYQVRSTPDFELFRPFLNTEIYAARRLLLTVTAGLL